MRRGRCVICRPRRGGPSSGHVSTRWEDETVRLEAYGAPGGLCLVCDPQSPTERRWTPSSSRCERWPPSARRPARLERLPHVRQPRDAGHRLCNRVHSRRPTCPGPTTTTWPARGSARGPTIGVGAIAVERGPAAPHLRLARALGVPVVIADANDSFALRGLNLHKAGAIAAVASNDLDNIAVSVAARAVAPDLRVVIRARALSTMKLSDQAPASESRVPECVVGDGSYASPGWW
ncbi:NAD-binding protein [Streptomyces sp. NPDC007205]|uniref:NAD-binding protein n=1 Tax=Streptomyces sp. NPDC007205 TaxID=3154316 RepID=UPI0033E63659